MKELQEIREKLEEMARKEAYKLWRLARKAEKHGATKTAQALAEEGSRLYTECTAYPDRLVHWKFEYNYKYAFR